jgi:hypothetical protein
MSSSSNHALSLDFLLFWASFASQSSSQALAFVSLSGSLTLTSTVVRRGQGYVLCPVSNCQTKRLGMFRPSDVYFFQNSILLAGLF